MISIDDLVPVGTPCTRQKTIDAVLDFYKFLTQIPYISPEKLMIPPANGWDNSCINETELRRRGKNDEVIDILRHLPYLDQEEYGKHWTLADNTLHINYAKGELYHDYLENDSNILPLPGHIIWLTEGFERAGCYLLLNTETWEIIEYTLLGESIEIAYEEYEAMPPETRWTAYSKMPANYYFRLWKWRHVTLQFILVEDPHAPYIGTAEFFVKDPRHLLEESIMPSDEEMDENWSDVDEPIENELDELDSHTEGEEEKEEEENDSTDSEIADEEEEEVRRELEDLSSEANEPTMKTDAQEEEAVSRKRRHRSMLYTLAQMRDGEMDYWDKPFRVAIRNEMKEIISIYICHGWPTPQFHWKTSGREYEILPPLVGHIAFDDSNFDRAGCLKALEEWMRQRRERQKEARRLADEAERTEITKQVLNVRHKLQKTLMMLGPPDQDAAKLQREIQRVMELLKELDEFEPIEVSVIQQTRVHKVLKVLVDNETLEEKDDIGVRGKAQEFLSNWEPILK